MRVLLFRDWKHPCDSGQASPCCSLKGCSLPGTSVFASLKPHRDCILSSKIFAPWFLNCKITPLFYFLLYFFHYKENDLLSCLWLFTMVNFRFSCRLKVVNKFFFCSISRIMHYSKVDLFSGREKKKPDFSGIWEKFEKRKAEIVVFV